MSATPAVWGSPLFWDLVSVSPGRCKICRRFSVHQEPAVAASVYPARGPFGRMLTPAGGVGNRKGRDDDRGRDPAVPDRTAPTGIASLSGRRLVFTKGPPSSVTKGGLEVFETAQLESLAVSEQSKQNGQGQGEGDVETGLAGFPALPSKAHHEPTTSRLRRCHGWLGRPMLPHIARQHNRPRSDSPAPPVSIRARCFLGYDGGRSSSNPFAALCLKSRLPFFAIVELSTFFFIFLHPPSLHSRHPRGVVVSRSPPREPASVIRLSTLRSIDLTSLPPPS